MSETAPHEATETKPAPARTAKAGLAPVEAAPQLPVAAATASAESMPPARKPGRHETEGLRVMNEIGELPREPGRSYCAILDPENANGTEYHLYHWQAGVNAWRRVGDGTYNRVAAIEALAGYVEHADVSLIDDFVFLDNLSRDDLDDATTERRTLICPEGVPGMADAWVAIGLDARGSGTAIHPGARLARTSLRERFVAAGRKAPSDPRPRTILVRHARAARTVVDKVHWDIGRPDLAGRQVDAELARNAQDAADRDRAWREDGIPPERMPAYRYARQQQGTW